MSRFQLPDPALWVVKMVQGAVAARCFGVEFLFDRHEIRCRVYGPPIPNALDLLKVLLGGDSPKERYIHHWLVALRSLFGRELAEWNWSSEIEGEREEVRLIDGEPVCRSSSCEHELDTLTISLKTPASRTPVSLSHAEYKYLCSLCALCPIPVTADGRLISQQHPACLIRADYAAIWMEGARVEQASFPLHTTNPHPKQMKPVLIARKPLPDGDEIRPCSRIVIVAPTRRQSPAGTEVFWLRDGALLGPVHLEQRASGARIQIVCPGDQLEMDLSEWGIREAHRFFPAEEVLSTIQEIGLHLLPRKSKSVQIDYKTDLPWLSKLGEFGLMIADFLAFWGKAEDKVGLPADFVDGVVDFGEHSVLSVARR